MGPALQAVPNTQCSLCEGVPWWWSGPRSIPMDVMSMESMSVESACAGSTCASMSTEGASQQISSENGRSLAGMNPGGMYTRSANATSMMLAMSVRLFRLQRLKRVSQAAILGGEILLSAECIVYLC